jgi:DNA-binding ferritin-like protein
MKKFTDFQINRTKLIKENNEAPIDMVIPANAEVAQVTQSEPSKFVSKLFESREMSHVYHLQITGEGSYVGHEALDEYYNGILDLIDEFVETYSGQYEIIEHYDIIDTSATLTKIPIDYFIELSEFIKQTRYIAILKEDSHLQNIIDEVVGLIYRTLYKLKNLK